MRIVRERFRGMLLELTLEPLSCGHHLTLTAQRPEWAAPLSLSLCIEYPARAGHVTRLFRALASACVGLNSLWQLREGDTPLHAWQPCTAAGSLLYEQPTTLSIDERLAFDLEAMPGWLCERHGKTLRGTLTLRETGSVVTLCTDFPAGWDSFVLYPINEWVQLCGVEIGAAMAKVPPGDSCGNIWKRNGGGYHFHHINDAKPKAEETFALEGGAA